MDTVPFTKKGYDLLKKELDNLKKNDRPKVIDEISKARQHGDLKENAEYHAAREKQGILEARISKLEYNISRANIIENNSDIDEIRFGARVTLFDENKEKSVTYKIVGELEADIYKNLISYTSPIARALIGKKIDDYVKIRVPKGIVEYIVKNIEY